MCTKCTLLPGPVQIKYILAGHFGQSKSIIWCFRLSKCYSCFEIFYLHRPWGGQEELNQIISFHLSMKVTKKNLGIFLIAYPIPLLVITLAFYAVLTFILASVVGAGDGSEFWIIIGSILRILLGFAGLLAVGGILMGIPIGIILLVLDYSQDKPKKNN